MTTPTHAARTRAPLSNADVAQRMEQVADLLEDQRASQYRVAAWRGGAATIRELAQPVAEVVQDEGLEGLDRLPRIGPALARAVRELVETGQLATLERLRGTSDPLALLASVPGIGPKLAKQVHDTLEIESLEALEAAAHDGRLATVPGFGAKRIAGIRDALASRLKARRRPIAVAADLPGVAEFLDVDREYRESAEAGALPLIAPRRFNPEHERWLPVLHTTRGDRHYTALYSNTARAHELGRTRDWVVLYYDGRDGERQCTVVTASRGPQEGRRVVRGREAECAAYYEGVASAGA
ncbi:MAG TPA: helix-hairpin-helix domain-containing protein [Gemmatimonadaceae bacterium]|nr:helix-hairpin-helix domain-containing protein [Gemmatimonadaceae bacterium]